LQVYSASIKSKFVDPSLNVMCCGWVKLHDGRCPSCHRVYNKEQTYDSLRKRFEVIMDLNRDQLRKLDIDNLVLPVKIANTFYAVPISVFKAFDDITSHEKHKGFFEMVQRTCNKIQFP